jgi:acyl-CoA reductase-like NAD-dependent aldehyde dehydrogenase
MSLADDIRVPLRNADRFFIGGEWVTPSSDAMIDVIDSGTEQLFFSVAEAQAADISRAVGAARQAFDEGPWPRLTHAQRAEYLTALATVANSSVIAQEEIFGPVLSVIAADNEEDAIRVANDTIYGLNASVFTNDVDRARDVARQLRSGTVGHNAFRTDFGIAFGGFKQSGIGREGGEERLRHFLEVKTVILEGTPAGYDSPDQ